MLSHPNVRIPYTLVSQISHLLLYPSRWLLVPGLSNHFCHCFPHNRLLRSALVSNVFGEIATRLWTPSVAWGTPSTSLCETTDHFALLWASVTYVDKLVPLHSNSLCRDTLGTSLQPACSHSHICNVLCIQECGQPHWLCHILDHQGLGI